MTTDGNAHTGSRPGTDQAAKPTAIGAPGAAPHYDGPPSFTLADPRSLTPLGRTLPADPLTGVTGSGGPGWLVPLGVSLVTAFVVFAAGGLVVRGWRSGESTPVVTTADRTPAAPAPEQGVPLSEVVKAKPAAPGASTAEPTEEQNEADEATGDGKEASVAGKTSKRTTRHRTRRSATSATKAQPTATADSAADYLPGTL